MKEIIFKNDIPVSVKGGRVFDRKYIIEQWLKRIILVAAKLKYGSARGSEIAGNRVSSLNELALYLLNEEIRDIIEYLTGISARELFQQLTSASCNETGLQNAVANFKSRFINNLQHMMPYQKGIYEPLKSYFEGLEKQNTGMMVIMDESEIQGEEYFEIVHLPCSTGFWEYAMQYERQNNKQITPWLNIEALVNSFAEFSEDIICIFVNMDLDEFSLIFSKRDVQGNFIRYKNLIDRFCNMNEHIYTHKPYEVQNPRFVCSPMIWFYKSTDRQKYV